MIAENDSTQVNLENVLANFPLAKDVRAGEMLTKSADSILTSPAVRQRLKDLLTDDALVESLLKFSYIHMNGFRKLVIFATPDDRFHMRLHQWFSKEKFDQNVHDHRFTFWSRILAGSITNKLWEPSSSGIPFTHYEYWPRDGRDTYQMKKVGDVFLKELEPFSVQQGESYFFGDSWLHTTDYNNAPVTLLLEDRRALRPYANVLVRAGKEYKDVVEYDSPSMSLEEYREGIRIALSFFQ